MTTKVGTKIGAVIGACIFLLFGIVPAFHFGGFATLALLSKLTGGPVVATILVRIILALGIFVSLFCMMSLGIVLGAIFGTVFVGVPVVLTNTRQKIPIKL